MGEKKLLGTKEYLRGEIAALQARNAELEAANPLNPESTVLTKYGITHGYCSQCGGVFLKGRFCKNCGCASPHTTPPEAGE